MNAICCGEIFVVIFGETPRNGLKFQLSMNGNGRHILAL
jgi:hypothetical protein